MIALLIRSLSLTLFLGLLGCGSGNPGALPAGPDLGPYSDLDQPENYTGATLYAYMNGGAEVILQKGFSRLTVRRYARGTDELIAELFEMKDSRAAALLYGGMRRPEAEAELIPGCVGSITPAEVLLAKGRYFLLCRNEDPMAVDGAAVRDLASRIAARLPGEGPEG
jgi:hypothetical protein